MLNKKKIKKSHPPPPQKKGKKHTRKRTLIKYLRVWVNRKKIWWKNFFQIYVFLQSGIFCGFINICVHNFLDTLIRNQWSYMYVYYYNMYKLLIFIAPQWTFQFKDQLNNKIHENWYSKMLINQSTVFVKYFCRIGTDVVSQLTC